MYFHICFLSLLDIMYKIIIVQLLGHSNNPPAVSTEFNTVVQKARVSNPLSNKIYVVEVRLPSEDWT